MSQKPIFLEPGAGRLYESGGIRGTILADGAETDNAQCFSEWALEPGAEGPPPHLHREHQESFYVVEGTVTFQVGEETVEASAGSFVFIPAGTVHGFSNPGDEPARCVNAWIPGGFEDYFRRVIEMAGGPSPDPSEIVALSERHDIFFA